MNMGPYKVFPSDDLQKGIPGTLLYGRRYYFKLILDQMRFSKEYKKYDHVYSVENNSKIKIKSKILFKIIY